MELTESVTRVRNHLFELGLDEIEESEGLFKVDCDRRHLQNMFITVNEDQVVFDQHIFDIPKDKNPAELAGVYERLLMMSGELVYGAFVLDQTGTKVLFHDTLAVDNLDLNELGETLEAVSLCYTEHADEIRRFL